MSTPAARRDPNLQLKVKIVVLRQVTLLENARIDVPAAHILHRIVVGASATPYTSAPQQPTRPLH